MFVWLLTTAFAHDLAVGEPDDTRTYKFEAAAKTPAQGARWDFEWKPLDLRFFSGLVQCERIAPRTDQCTFARDELEHGFRLRDSDRILRFSIEAPPEFRVEYSDTGTATVTLTGDLDPFYSTLADAQLDRFHDPDAVAWPRNSQNEVGKALAESLTNWLAAALSLEIPDADATTEEWLDEEPVAARTWTASRVSGDVTYRVEKAVPAQVHIRGAGPFTEVHTHTDDWEASGHVERMGTWDTDRGVAVATRTTVRFDRHAPEAFTRVQILMAEATPAHTPAAGELEGSILARN